MVMMKMIRAEPKAIMKHCRRAFGSRAAIETKHIDSSVQTSQCMRCPTRQQRQLLNGTSAVAGLQTPFQCSLIGRVEDYCRRECDLAEMPVKPVPSHSIVSCKPVNSGNQVVLEFGDRSRYELHSTWLRDAHPARHGDDFYRVSPADVWRWRGTTIKEATVSGDGHKLSVTYDVSGTEHRELFAAHWLHAFAPFVGKALNGSLNAAQIKGTGSLFDDVIGRRRSWRCDTEMPCFDATTLRRCVDTQVAFLETVVEKGIAMITGMGTPASLEREPVGKPIYDLVFDVIGKLNQHPVRSTSWGSMRKTAEAAKQGSDYDMSNPLSMHTDHSVYHGTPGFLQFMWQAQGSVQSRVADGLALAEHVREHHPEAYELLTTVDVTHSSRNVLYNRSGEPRDVRDESNPPVPFELVHTHPIIVLDADGQVEKIVQSETKRGVCAIPYDTYEPFMQAYKLWTDLCEDARFIKHFDWPEGNMLVLNNWRALHGRATVPPGMPRTLAFGYINKILVENRYRLLKQLQTERANPSLDSRWLTRIPNQALNKLTVNA